MPRRLALEKPPGNVCLSNTLIFMQLRTLSRATEREGPWPLVPNRPKSASHELLSLLECALMSKHRVLPGFGRSCLPATLLKSALAKTPSATPLECALTKKGGGRGDARPHVNCFSRLCFHTLSGHGPLATASACFFLFFHL